MSKKTLMRLCLLLFTVMLLFSFSACSITDKFFHKEEPSYRTEESTSQTTTDVSNTTPSSTTSTTQVTATTATTENTTVTSAEYAEKEETLWATTDVNIREKPDTDSKKLGVLHEGNSIKRIAKGSDGWSKVIFQDKEAYIYSSYLTDKEPARTVSSDRITVDPDSDLWYLTVVNTEREIPADYVPRLAEVASSGKYLDYRVAPYYNDMYAAAKKDGIILTPYSGYRSYARQQRNYNNLTETYMSRYGLSRSEAAAKAATVILPPGTSEHNLGLAMDICNTNSTFKNQKEYQWLTEHAHEYGFILRYTAEKQSITGIIPEPWHWRFVGVEHAEKIKNSGLCLEEYLEQEGIAY